MKKTLLFIVLTIFLASNAFTSLAMAQTPLEALPLTGQTTTDSTTSIASIVKIKSTGSFINDGKNMLKEVWQKVAGSKRGEVIEKVKTWFANRKQAIKNGWQEEKKEFHGNIKDIITNAWQKAIDKVKSWVIRK